jgi:hypothetical protein
MRKTHRLAESDIRKIVRNILSEAELYPAVTSPLPKHNDVGQYPAVGSGEPAGTKRTGISAEEAEEAFNDSYEYNLKHDGKKLLDAIATHLLNIGVFR